MGMKLRQPKSQRAKPTRPAPKSKPSLRDAEGARLARKGERLYRTKLKALLEPAYIGKFAAIEPDSGEYFLGDRMIEAVDKAEAKYPDKLVYIVRIGFRAAVKMRNRISV